MAEERREVSPSPTAGPDLGSLLGGLLQGGEGQAGALGEGLGAVLRDPEAMAKLPAMIEMLRPMMGAMTASSSAPSPSHEEGDAPPKEESQPVAAMTKSEPPHLPSGKKEGGGRGGCHERRIALLCALRPYLNPRRQEAIDYILRMDRMGKLFRQG